MQEDLLSVIACWEAERALLATTEKLKVLDAAITAADVRVSEVAAEIAATSARLDALRAEEKVIQKRLDDATTRKTRTQALIDSGKATDMLVAQRQVETAQTQAAELETQVFGLMEAQEEAVARLAELTRSATLAAARRREAEVDRDAAAPGLRREQAEQQAEFAARQEALLRGDLTRYKNLRVQGLRPIARVKGGACDGCHAVVPPQLGIEIKRGTKTHNCRGCQRWLIDET